MITLPSSACLRTAGSAIPAPLVPILVALLALLSVGALHALARRLRFLPSPSSPHHPAPERPPITARLGSQNVTIITFQVLSSTGGQLAGAAA